MKHSQADVSAAQRDLGYSPSVSVQEGLRLTLEWFSPEGLDRRGRPPRALGVRRGVARRSALLRFVTLDHQSLWYDEALSWQLVVQPFGDMVQGVADTENTPPLFYVLAHFSTELFGADEVGLRLVSALAGVATIAVAFLCGRELADRRAGLIAACLVAANPFLFWFSQEARAYALLVLLTAIALFCFLRVIAEPRSRWALAGWVVSSAAAVATHYFAIFPMAAEAVWIERAARERTHVAPAPAGNAGRRGGRRSDRADGDRPGGERPGRATFSWCRSASGSARSRSTSSSATGGPARPSSPCSRRCC